MSNRNNSFSLQLKRGTFNEFPSISFSQVSVKRVKRKLVDIVLAFNERCFLIRAFY